MPQIQGIKGEAVVVYCESLITMEMGYLRLLLRLKIVFSTFQKFPCLLLCKGIAEGISGDIGISL